MRFWLMHVDDAPAERPQDDDVTVLLRAENRTTVIVPLDALPEFLPILQRASEELDSQRCPSCSAQLPAVPAWEDDAA